MTRRLLAALVLASSPLLGEAITPAASAGTTCANLAALTIPNVTIRSATVVPAGPFTPPGTQTVVDGQPQRAPAPMTLPAFCRIEATARPTSDSDIRFEVWIPPVEAWNGKFQGVGNGGYQGSISYAAMAIALRRGYATASTDTGHTGDDMKFGQGHPEKLIDYAYRAVHVMTESAKLIVRDASGRFADKSYFVGCSAGGQQALSEAQRYPDDYDGIVAGDPANNRIRQTFAFLHSWIATHDRDGKPIIPQAKLALLTKSAVSRIRRPASRSSPAGRAAAKGSARRPARAGAPTSWIRRNRCASASSSTGCSTIRTGTTTRSIGNAISPTPSRSCRTWPRSTRISARSRSTAASC
jgi:feruloyl esterase